MTIEHGQSDDARWRRRSTIRLLGAAVLLLSAGVAVGAPPPGEADYQRVCADCHDKGADKNKLSRGAPRLGDRNAWESRLRKGVGGLYKPMIEAPRHGKKDDAAWDSANPFIWREDLSDEQIRVVIEYMLEQAAD